MASSPSRAPPDFELQLAACAGLRSLDSFISLFSFVSSSSSSSSMQQQLHQLQSMDAATDTINKFKHLESLLSTDRKGHARVRQAPRFGVSSANTMQRGNSPNLSSTKPHLGNPNLHPCASESFQFSQFGLPASCQGSGSSSFLHEECTDSVNVDDDGHSLRGTSHIDLNQYQNDYEGSVNQVSMRGPYTQSVIKARDCPSITDDYHNQPNNYSVSSLINDNNPCSFDLNQQAPSLDSSSSLTSSVHNHMSPTCISMAPSRPPLFCPQSNILPLPPPPEESFSFDAHTQSPATLVLPAAPLAFNTLSHVAAPPGSDDDFANNPNQISALFEGRNSLNRQLAQIFATNPNFEAQLEKAAGRMMPTPTLSHISCISLQEGNMIANGGVPRVQGPQSSIASMDQKGSSAGKRKCSSVDSSDDSKLTKCGNSPSKCHCSKRRKVKNKSTMRVPAISEKIAEIPHDDYSWRKYGQKPIKGSPYPRGYYKCSGVKGCPAKKHVERALDDPSMLIITYEGEHIHSQSLGEEPCKYDVSSLQ